MVGTHTLIMTNDNNTDKQMSSEPTVTDATVDSSDRKIIEVNNLQKNFGQLQALQGVNLEVKENEILALVGDNGAGKSTFVNTVTGVLEPTSGSIYIRENERMIDETYGVPNNLETVFQDLELTDKHSVASNVFMGREPVEGDFLSRLFRKVDRSHMEQEALSALKEIGMPIDPKTKVQGLSGGERQAVAIARAIISNPQIVILDEPTAEVSVEGREKILDLMGRLNSEGRTILFVTHNLEEVFEVADRVAIFRNGEAVNVLEVDETLNREDLVGLMTGAIGTVSQ